LTPDAKPVKIQVLESTQTISQAKAHAVQHTQPGPVSLAQKKFLLPPNAATLTIIENLKSLSQLQEFYKERHLLQFKPGTLQSYCEIFTAEFSGTQAPILPETIGILIIITRILSNYLQKPDPDIFRYLEKIVWKIG
jgi:hypothetical protein